MTPSSFPALYQAADTASKSAQNYYVRLFRATLVLLLVGALLGAVSIKSGRWQEFSSIGAAVLLAASLALNSALKLLAPEKTWFGGRAVAESVKSVAWRYMVGGDPFRIDLDPTVAISKFSDELKAILKERRSLSAKFTDPANALQITPEMEEQRRKSTDERLALYLRERVQNQRTWYSSKAKEANRSNLTWFWISTGGQTAALISAIMMVRVIDAPVKLTGFFSAAASSAMAWLQMKRYQDLAQAYSLAAHELGLIELEAEKVRVVIRSMGVQIHAEEQLASFIANAENAISREHTMWVARRDVG